MREVRLGQWWRDAKLGLFLHWGPASLSGAEISWGMKDRIEGGPQHQRVERDTYMNLYRRFNPVNFDADEWMRLAQDAGMKYVVFVTKHHDGFSLWPTQQIRSAENPGLPPHYSIADTPYQRDLCRMIADAAHRHGLRLGWYYSTRDWTHPKYLQGDNDTYNRYYQAQVRELLNNYGQVDMMWFDHCFGDWSQYTIVDLFREMYGLQPDLLINNRAARGLKNIPAGGAAQLVQGDYDTPEQRIGTFQRGRAWESCVTMTQCADGGGWSYRPDGRTRTLEECLRMLVSTVTGDGNLLLNVGPMPDGRFQPQEIANLQGMGQWLRRFGASIYGTRGGPYRNGAWGGSCYRDQTLYLHVFQWTSDTLRLPPLKARVLHSAVLTGGTVALEQSETDLRLALAGDQQDRVDTVIKLELDKLVAEIPPVEVSGFAPTEDTLKDLGGVTPIAAAMQAPSDSRTRRPAGDWGRPASLASPPSGALGFPSRAVDLDALPGFRNPPAGYGEVPFWWWTGDSLDKERLLWQIEQLHRQGIAGMQINYAHQDTPGWPTYPAQPEIFSEAWWEMWQWTVAECRKRSMGLGLSGYTLDWPGKDNLFGRLLYGDPQLNGIELILATRVRAEAGQLLKLDIPADALTVQAHPWNGDEVEPASTILTNRVKNGRLEWMPPAGVWRVYVFCTRAKPLTLNPMHPQAGQKVIERFFQPCEDHAPGGTSAGLNYFFQDELQFGVAGHIWVQGFAEEFRKRKGYELLPVLAALFDDIGPITPKVRLDYEDVKVQLTEERYFRPIFDWHWKRGLIYACDPGSRGQNPAEFGDYFRCVRWYTAPGHDTPGDSANLIKDKVSSSIAHLYQRPRVWLEGYHSLGWGATPATLMKATCENYLYGCTLLNLHGLYYTTHGSFWEWAPPCYHFRMPYWDHMGVFLRYFERLSYLLSQGVHCCDVAIMYPAAPWQAGLGGKEATDTAFETGRRLMAAGIDFDFMDFQSLTRAEIHEGRLRVSGEAYHVLVLPALRAVEWSTIQKAREFASSGGIVIAVGPLPQASDRAGRDDPELNAVVKDLFGKSGGLTLSRPEQVPGAAERLVPRQVQASAPVKALHRRVGPRDVYMVLGAAKGSECAFRSRGRVELWDPWTGRNRPMRVVSQTAEDTTIRMPLEDYEAQVIVFSPAESPPEVPISENVTATSIALDGPWEFEIKPTLDNRWGDFRLPLTEKVIGPEARIFRYAEPCQADTGWAASDFDDSHWSRVTCGFGQQFWKLGPLSDDADTAALDSRLASLRQVDPALPVDVGGRSYRWTPYVFSWRWGVEGDPGHQGYHGLKEDVTDDFICLGKPKSGLNETLYTREDGGGRYYLWTSAVAPEAGRVNLRAGGLKPAAAYLNGEKSEESVLLVAGANPLLLRYDQPGRGHFVLERAGAPEPEERTPLAMTWHDRPGVVPFDVRTGVTQPTGWYRFTTPPGLRAMEMVCYGVPRAWADGQPMQTEKQASGAGGLAHYRVVAAQPVLGLARVALHIEQQRGYYGGSALPEPIQLECGPGQMAVGDWSKAGALECYSGGAWYRRTVPLTAEQVRGRVLLHLGDVVATAEVRVNGRVAGVRVAPPWTVDISAYVHAGEDRIEILVYNTLANHYLTIPTRYRGSLRSGLIGPVRLELRPVE
ncbi:MAG: alpha-L-fucosidase [Planctomycetes bacterium]|jgi:hypothetical protein|nr:alpha-L-fucosidase [Planctomycetota bacterium]